MVVIRAYAEIIYNIFKVVVFAIDPVATIIKNEIHKIFTQKPQIWLYITMLNTYVHTAVYLSQL